MRIDSFQVWNSTLARLALNYAGECKWEHSPQSYRTNAAGFRYVGENLAAGSRILVNSILESTAASAVERWCNERKYFTYPTTCDSGAMCGHYTQVLCGISNVKSST